MKIYIEIVKTLDGRLLIRQGNQVIEIAEDAVAEFQAKVQDPPTGNTLVGVRPGFSSEPTWVVCKHAPNGAHGCSMAGCPACT